ncbi:radical SAM family heme chaperone HemW [Megasphaera sp.]|uniref:radical SAM family heme chaperone HemW n=1 Tax=Megasphaera sp. TaxID=2023260 RepID=UPI0025B7BF85|nr:radical SAM family heme chaperone HemW [Megasphaera sp.]MCF0152326.1 radical SAM family heme chaperone HemW [Megasphaera sp.]
MRLGLYVHIPFCRHKCLYCDFPSYAGLERYRDGYVQALCRDIAASPYAGEEADTIYLGGGTPSILAASDIGRILKTLRQTFRLAGDAEITMEANPDSLDYEKAAALAGCGVNRLSLGVQSFSDEMLAFLGRVHTAAQGEAAIEAAYEAGIHNLSLDLMYGLPGQSLADVRRDVERLSQLPVVHASIYSLIVEEGTQLKAGLEKGTWQLPPDGTVEAMGKAVHDAMHGAGFHHYEISSYAKGPFESRHNSKYWTYDPYLGFGVSAHSFDGTTRWANMANIPAYIRKAGKGSVVAESVAIDAKRAAEDYCFLALRRRAGIDYGDYARRFGRSIEADFGPVIAQLVRQGLLERTPQGCCLSEEGLGYGNYVFSKFIR